MERVPVNGAAVALVVCPWHFVHGIERIGYLISVHHLAHTVDVGTARQLIPLVVGQPVVVGILRHHHYARLGSAANGIAADVNVSLPAYVGNAVVEVKRDIASVSPKAYHAALVARNGFGTLCNHCRCVVAFFILRHGVDKLSGCRHILVNSLDVLAVLCYGIHPLSVRHGSRCRNHR